MELLKLIRMQKFYNITSIICMIICVAEAILYPFDKTKKADEDENGAIPIIDPKGHVNLVNLLILLILSLIIIIASIWYFKLDFNYLYIPMLTIVIYFIILKSFISAKSDNLQYTTYSSLCFCICYIVQSINYEFIIKSFSNTLLIESFVLLVLLTKIYIFLFSILINIRYFLKLIKSVFKIKKLKFNLSEKLMINYNKSFKYTKLKGAKKLLLFFIYPYELIVNIIKLFSYSIYNVIILPIILIVGSLLKFVNIIINYDDGQFKFLICKMLLVITFIVVYIVIIINKGFTSKLINIYEYVSTAIIIPILLESIISFKNYISSIKKIN